MTTTQGRRPADPGARPPRAAVAAVQRLFRAETPEFFVLLGTTLFLVLFGLVMVLSSSSIESRASDGDFFAVAARQAVFAAIGLPVMLIAARAPIVFWKRWAGWAIALAVVLQFLVFTPLGYETGGNRNWISLGSITAQPSELVKFALVIWLAWVLTTKADLLNDWRHVLLPIGPVVAVAIGLVLAGNDLGTAIILLMTTLGALFYAGVRLGWIALASVGIALVGAVFAVASDSRRARIDAWLSGCADPADYSGDCWQTVHGWQALAHGGLVGVGLGNSTGKWNWIPEAHNDFIFAIIGEELGMLGALLVLALFAVLTVCFVRIVRMSRDPFAKIATSAAMVWIVGQAFVNIAVVLGVLPVLGVPLPLVSAGGSALITTLAAIGVVLSFARHRPVDPAPVARRPGTARG